MTPDLRQKLRTCRQNGQIEEGRKYLFDQFSKEVFDPQTRAQIWHGLTELRDGVGADLLHKDLIERSQLQKADDIAFLKLKSAMGDYLICRPVLDRLAEQSLGPAAQILYEQVNSNCRVMEEFGLKFAYEAIAPLTELLLKRPRYKSKYNRAFYYTGQLGPGGAETQLTRHLTTFPALRPDLEFSLAVRHTRPETRGDHYLGKLVEHGITPFNLSQCDAIEDFKLRKNEQKLFNLLSADIRKDVPKLAHYIAQNKFDTSFLWQDGGVLLGGLASLIAGVPKLVTCFRGLPPNLRPKIFRPELEPFYNVLFQSDHVVLSSNSSDAADAYIDWLKIPSKTITILPNAVPPPATDANTRESDLYQDILDRSPDATKTVLGVFRFTPVKSPKTWVECAIKYAKSHPDTRLIAVGEGELREECLALIKEAGMCDQVFLPGLSSHVGFWLSKADCTMHMAAMEGLPNVLIEAHLCGSPVVATPAGSTHDVVDHGKTGFILSNAAKPSLSQACRFLEQILSDLEHAKNMGAIGREKCLEKYGVSQVFEQTLRLLDMKGTQ